MCGNLHQIFKGDLLKIMFLENIKNFFSTTVAKHAGIYHFKY
jgi:hypothetical protein